MVGSQARRLIAAAGVFALAGCRTGTIPRSTSPARAPQRTASIAPPSMPPVRGVAMIHNAHCGGAMLTPEQQARLSRPAARVAFVVLPGSHNTAAAPVARFTTDEAGGFELPSLPAGTYCVVRAANQLSAKREAELLALPPAPPLPPIPPNKTVVDQACLKRLPLQCDATWKTGTQSFRPRVDLAGSRCPWNRPCTHYNGPLPP